MSCVHSLSVLLCTLVLMLDTDQGGGKHLAVGWGLQHEVTTIAHGDLSTFVLFLCLLVLFTFVLARIVGGSGSVCM